MKRSSTSLKSRIIVIALGIALGYLAKTIFPAPIVNLQVSPPVSSENTPQH